MYDCRSSAIGSDDGLLVEILESVRVEVLKEVDRLILPDIWSAIGYSVKVRRGSDEPGRPAITINCRFGSPGDFMAVMRAVLEHTPMDIWVEIDYSQVKPYCLMMRERNSYSYRVIEIAAQTCQNNAVN